MTIDERRLIQFIKALHKGTMEGKIHWERTAVKGLYLANFPDYAVRISAELPKPVDQLATAGLQGLMGDDPRVYYVRIYNDNGDMLEEITDRQFTKTPQFSPREVMMELYNVARP